MSRRLLIVLLIVFAIAGGAFLWLRVDPRAQEIRRLEAHLGKLAGEVSFTESDPPFRRLGYPNRLSGFFANPTELDIAVGPRSAQGSLSRSQLEEGATTLRATARGLDVRFLDPSVELDDSMENATVHLTSRIFFTGDPDYLVQEFQFVLKKNPDGEWRIHRIATVRTME